MNRSKIYNGLLKAGRLSLLLLIPLLQGCFTGVESTGKIKLTKKELAAVSPTREDNLLSDIRPVSLKEWKVGRGMVIADGKFLLVAEKTGDDEIREGDTITYTGIETRIGAGGDENCVLVFSTVGGGRLGYPIEKPMEDALNQVTTADIPMLVDLPTVDAVKERLKDRSLWTRTSLWYDENLRSRKGKKFVEVKITDVTHGNSFFPVLVSFTDNEGDTGKILMNVGNGGTESRNFGKLFSLTDPRKQYKNISDENWKAIQSEELRIGMTKEECRLSIGTPTETDAGHDYSNTMDIWYYANGGYLRFVDGLLVGYK